MPRETITLEVIHGTLNGLCSKMDVFADEQNHIKRKLEELTNSQQFISTQFDDFQKTLKQMTVKQAEMECELAIKNTLIADLTLRLNNLEQYTRNSSIEIRAVNKMPEEDVEKIVVDVAKYMSIPLSRDDIQAAHRLPAQIGKCQTIIASLKNRKIRDKMVAFRGTITNTNLFGEGQKGKIYVGESLSPFFKSLLWKTKSKAKDANYKFVWFKKNCVLAKKDENSAIITIRSEDDLKKKMI